MRKPTFLFQSHPQKSSADKWSFVALVTNGPDACNGIFVDVDLIMTNSFCCTSLGVDDADSIIYVRSVEKSIKVKFSINSKGRNQCLIKLEKSDFRPALPCLSPTVSHVPELNPAAPNCFVGGWHWEETGGSWQLRKSLSHEIWAITYQLIRIG